MEAPVVSRLLLAIPAGCILALLIEHIRRNQGPRIAAAYAVTCALYGIVRGAWVLSISNSNQAPMPYRMAGSIRIGAASPMEIAGWMLAAALAWLAGAAIVRLLGLRPGTEPPYRVAFTGAVILAALSLAVETAAIAAGWWSWSIPPPPGELLRVPQIAMVDWAFVAFDFLLPFLLFTRPASAIDRIIALSLFPIHFLSHRYLEPLLSTVPFSLFELAHFGIPVWVFWRAAGEAPLPARARTEWGFFVPGLAALLVAADTVLTVVLAGRASETVFLLPLIAVGLAAIVIAGLKRTSDGATKPRPLTSNLWRAAAVALALALIVFVRIPANRRRDGYARNFIAAVDKFNAGDLPGARALLEEAIDLRPDKAEPHLILALALFRLDRRDESTRELEEALRLKPALAETNEAKALRAALAEGK